MLFVESLHVLKRLRKWNSELLVWIFVDSDFWSKYWSCHRLSHRSFKIQNRQFHICARCTGLVSGIFLIPFAPISSFLPLSFLVMGCTVTFVDGLLQLVTPRESTNAFRFASSLPVACCSVSILIKSFN